MQYREIVGAVLAALVALAPISAHAISGVLCIKSTGKGAVKVRNPTCKPSEVQVGTFDTDATQANFTNDVSVLVRLPSNTSVASASVLSFGPGSEVYDTSNLHDEAINPTRLTAPVAGKYIVIGHVHWGWDATGSRMAYLLVNGVYEAFSTTPTVPVGLNSAQTVVAQLSLAAGDYVELVALQNSGGPLNAEATLTDFGMVKMP